MADIVAAKIRELRVQLDAHAARITGLENAAAYRDGLDQLKNRLDRIERTTEKAAIVRLTARGGGA